MSKISRRHFGEGTGAGLMAATVIPPLKGQQAAAPLAAAADATVPRTAIKLSVNGIERRIEVEDCWTLVELLRDHLGLTGTKIGCQCGECGACTVLVNGKSLYSCSQLAVWMDGKRVETVEGLAMNGKLDPLQEAFIEHDGPQCGYCTSGQLMSVKALLLKNPHPAGERVDEILIQVHLPAAAKGLRSSYHKEMDRGSWTHAIISVALALEMDGFTKDNVCRKARVALGGVAPIPWRVPKVEAMLSGKRITAELAAQAGQAAVEGAQPLAKNAYKVALTAAIAKRTLASLGSA
jgi:aerobic-type carbon monoxide dehydrogenase small subunit (CoxS/CutS family)